MKRLSGTVVTGLVFGLLSVALFLATGAWAKPTTPEQAKTVVANWLAQEAQPLGAPLGGQVREVQTFKDSDGNPAYYVVCLNPSGLVFLPADDLVEPIVGFVSGATSYDPSPTNRLGRLISGDLPGRVRQARQVEAQLMAAGAPLAGATPQAAAQQKWAWLAANSPIGASPLMGAGAPAITSISPSGHAPGTFTVILTGGNFTGITEVTCSYASLSFTWTLVSDTLITIDATFPVGTYTFTVVGPNGSATSPALTVGQFGLASLSDVRVAPFIQSNWGSTTVDGSQGMPQGPYSWPCYNYFTPPYPAGGDYNFLNYPCGAIATAELMRFWQYPTTGVGRGMFTITVNGGQSCWTLRGGDGLGGPYQWSNMPLNPISVFDPLNPLASDVQRQAIGNLTHDIDLTLNMDYEWTYSPTTGYDGTNKYRMADVAQALVSTFKYGNAMAGGNAGKNIPCPNRDAMINPNLDAGYPVVLSVTASGPGVFFDAVCDGYGYNLNSMYHHLHMGYNTWFNLPLVFLSTTDQDYQFNILTDIIYNVYVSGAGEIISGRVNDASGNPLSGATVTATGGYTATTNANGIYALAKVPSTTTFTLTVSKTGYSFFPQTVTTGKSISNTAEASSYICGNLWGVDFTANSTLGQALDNTQLAFPTSGAADWYAESSYWYYGGSAAQSGAIDYGQSSTLQTTVTGPGVLTFYWSTSSTPLYNKITLTLDSSYVDMLSGIVGWSQKTVNIPAGLHTVAWTYSKIANASGSLGSDCGWVDKVVYTRENVIHNLEAVYQLLLLQ